MQTRTPAAVRSRPARSGKIPRKFFEPCPAGLCAGRAAACGGADVSEAQLPAGRAPPVRPPPVPNPLRGRDRGPAGPLFAIADSRKSTTRRPADPDIDYTRIDAGAPTGLEPGATQNSAASGLTGQVAVWPAGRRHRPVARTRSRTEVGGNKMIDQAMPRLASRQRSATAPRRATALHSSGRRVSTGLQAASGGKRIRQIATHAHPSSSSSFVETARKGMCARAPVPMRPIFTF